jgi:uncharacterized protein
MSAVLGTVASLFRFPVKSMRGERLRRAAFGPSGLEGDRAWALLDEEGHWASAKTNRARWRLYDGMFDLQATTIGTAEPEATKPGAASDVAATPGGPVPVGPGPATARPTAVDVALPDGRLVRAGTAEADAVLSAHLGGALHFDHGDGGRRWGRHHDGSPLHLVTTATLEALASDDDGAPGERDALDPLRLRPNLVVRTPTGVVGFEEDRWIGATLRIGDVVLRTTETTGRCVMTTRAQGDLPLDPTVLKRIGRRNGADAGIYLDVLEPGTIDIGDELVVLDPGPGMIPG